MRDHKDSGGFMISPIHRYYCSYLPKQDKDNTKKVSKHILGIPVLQECCEHPWPYLRLPCWDQRIELQGGPRIDPVVFMGWFFFGPKQSGPKININEQLGLFHPTYREYNFTYGGYDMFTHLFSAIFGDYNLISNWIGGPPCMYAMYHCITGVFSVLRSKIFLRLHRITPEKMFTNVF